MFPLLDMYNRYAVLPLDSLMKLRRRHAGQDQHKTALQEQHKSFMFVHRNIKGTKMIKRVKMKNFRFYSNFQGVDVIQSTQFFCELYVWSTV